MNNKLLKEYVTATVEGMFMRDANADVDSPRMGKSKGFLHKIKSLFMGEDDSHKIAEEWIEDQELNYDFELNDKTKKQIRLLSRC